MQGLVIVLSLAVAALARPDIGLQLRQGYQYNQPPATSYGVPSGSYIPSPSSGFQTPHGHQGFASHQHGAVANNGFNTFGQQSSQSGSTFTQNNNAGYNNNNAGFTSSGSSGSAGFNSGLNSGSSGFIGTSGGAPQISKHVYFYDAPEDTETTQIRVRTQPSVAQKSYKIIFIKAPSYKAPEIPQIPVQQQNEEKTLVYVLVKKQDDIQDIVIPSSTPLKPSKPEVFFIKYKTQKEAEEQIQGIQQGASSGISANNVGSDAAFISTIQDTKESNINSGFDNKSFQSGNVNTIGGNTHSTGDFSQHGSSSSSSQSFASGNTHNFGPAGASGPY